MKWPRLKHVRARLTLWYVFVLGILLVIGIAGASFVLVWQLHEQLERHVVQDLEMVEGLLYFDGGGHLHFNEDYHNHSESKLVQERFLEVLSPDGAILYRNDRLGNRTIGGAPFPGEGVGGYSERSERVSDGTSLVLASRQHSMQDRTILIRVGYSPQPIWTHLKEFVAILLLALPLTLAAASIAGYLMAKRALDPISQMARQAEEITTERLHDRLPMESDDELGHLAGVFNQMLARIEQSFEQLRRFTADASHELRTPLASIRTIGEVGLQCDATPEEYRDIIGSILEEINRMTSLVDNLLMLSRADAGQIPLNLDMFPVAEVMKDAALLLEPLMDEKEQKFRLEADEEILVRGDRLILRQAAINILHNAVKFTPVGGNIAARIFCEGSRIVLSVTDSGPGISTEHLARVFDRFYRIDPSRSNIYKGAGLGLSIAQWVAQAHDGEIGLSPAKDGGCTFWIRLPLASSSTIA
ncbi:MAG: HAMP domain-containing protein [Acidobacteriia bacterium]|nr:HAMP domain-containing protein [Terriglobia bacterium]